mmetsp:Transcript_18997/g.44659  ORF Transcript_18997/g.44659 Transcript_18997/m.44659 type:complete len:350 (-) Transcript_18997:119-1168(-)
MDFAPGTPLYQTLVAAFPQGLMPEGLENTIRWKVRRRLRDIAYRVVFPPEEQWQTVVEHFAIAGIERIHRAFGDNPWFWVMAWPSVFGAAALEFWPEHGTPAERRCVAADASAAHLEALLISRALGDSEAAGALPMPALKGLRALGQSTLPALPSMCVNDKVDAKLRAAELLKPLRASYQQRPIGSAMPASLPTRKEGTHPGGQELKASSCVPESGIVDPVLPQDPSLRPQQGSVEHNDVFEREVAHAHQAPHRATDAASRGAVDVSVAGHDPGVWLVQAACAGSQPCVWVVLERSSDAYGELSCALCNECWEPCGLDCPGEAKKAPFLHCAECSMDLCAKCAGLATEG